VTAMILLRSAQAARTVSILKIVGPAWQSNRGGAVAIRLPDG
jgi:hypothetical protein